MLLANFHFAGATPPFSSFSSISGVWGAKSWFLWVECNIRIFANFRQNHLFSAGDKTTVFQNDRFDNPEIRGRKKLQKFPRVTSIGSPPPEPSENHADPRRTPQRPRRTLRETPRSSRRDPRRALWEANFLGEPRGGLCPSDGDPPEL